MEHVICLANFPEVTYYVKLYLSWVFSMQGSNLATRELE